MRVLLVANTLPPTDLSGVGEQVLQLASGLREAGHEVEILGRGEGGARGPKVLFPLTVVAPVIRRLRGFRPHVVQVHESDGALAAFVCRVLAGLQDPPPKLVALLQVSYLEELRAVRPLVVDGRVVGRPGGVEKRFRWLKAPWQIVLGCLSAWLADVVLAPSARTAGEIERDYKVRRVVVLPNVMGGLRVAAPTPVAKSDPGSVEPYLLFVGRLRVRKGLEVLFEALSRLPHGAAPRLRIAGDGEHREALERRARKLDLEERVAFLGRRDAAEVRRLLTGARALVVPSIYEGMPLVVLEAMEEGVPVVASAVSGIPEVVVAGETGWLVPAEDATTLAAVLAEVGENPDEARRRGAAGRRRLDERYRPHHAAARWTALVAEPARSRKEVGNG